jgi:hypothetical protein
MDLEQSPLHACDSHVVPDHLAVTYAYGNRLCVIAPSMLAPMRTTVRKRTFDMFDEAHWRGRAMEIRVLAELIGDPACRQQALEIADNYDKLAERSKAGGGRPDGEGSRAAGRGIGGTPPAEMPRSRRA